MLLSTALLRKQLHVMLLMRQLSSQLSPEQLLVQEHSRGTCPQGTR